MSVRLVVLEPPVGFEPLIDERHHDQAAYWYLLRLLARPAGLRYRPN
jgi:hypothetical protein